MADSYPAAAGPDFSGSARSITHAVGFAPESSSDPRRWSRLGLYAWRGHCQRAEFEPFQEPVIVYHVGGANDVEVSTRRQCRQRTHPGRITIIPPETVIAWDIKGEVHSRTIHLRSDFLDRVADDGGQRRSELQFRCGIEDPVVITLIEALELQLRSPSEVGSLSTEELADSVARHLLSMHSGGVTRPPGPGGLSQPVLKRCIDRLHSSITTGISLQALADEAGLSRTYFADAFRKTTGKAPHQYLTQVRLAHAHGLLKRSELRIADIAFRCGFSSQAHLTRAFHKAYGKPPRRFRVET